MCGCVLDGWTITCRRPYLSRCVLLHFCIIKQVNKYKRGLSEVLPKNVWDESGNEWNLWMNNIHKCHPSSQTHPKCVTRSQPLWLNQFLQSNHYYQRYYYDCCPILFSFISFLTVMTLSSSSAISSKQSYTNISDHKNPI